MFLGQPGNSAILIPKKKSSYISMTNRTAPGRLIFVKSDLFYCLLVQVPMTFCTKIFFPSFFKFSWMYKVHGFIYRAKLFFPGYALNYNRMTDITVFANYLAVLALMVIIMTTETPVIRFMPYVVFILIPTGTHCREYIL